MKHYRDVSENSGTPKSSILIGFSIINHPFWGVSPFLETSIYNQCWPPEISHQNAIPPVFWIPPLQA